MRVCCTVSQGKWVGEILHWKTLQGWNICMHTLGVCSTQSGFWIWHQPSLIELFHSNLVITLLILHQFKIAFIYNQDWLVAVFFFFFWINPIFWQFTISHLISFFAKEWIKYKRVFRMVLSRCFRVVGWQRIKLWPVFRGFEGSNLEKTTKEICTLVLPLLERRQGQPWRNYWTWENVWRLFFRNTCFNRLKSFF